MKKILITLLCFLNILILFIPNIYLISIGNTILVIVLALIIFLEKEKVKVIEVEKEVEVENKVTKNFVDKIDIETKDPQGHSRPKSCLACTEHIYYLKKSIPFIEKLTENTQKYEEEILSKLFNQFETLWKESDEIVTESGTFMRSIFDPNGTNNIGSVLNSSVEINSEFANFLSVLKVMNKLTDEFINTSVSSFDAITKTTKDIVELSEQVKVISINVRIEAARIQDSGGFKVLGSDISDFADKTSKVALETNDQIQETVKHIKELKDNLTTELLNVETMANSIFSKVNPFEDILKESSNSIIGVIDNLHNVSGNLSEDIGKTIANLQYHDIASQQTDHVLEFLKNIENNGLLDRDVNIYLDAAKKTKIKKQILSFIGRLSSTDSERDQLDKCSKKWGVNIDNEKTAIDKGAGSITLF